MGGITSGQRNDDDFALLPLDTLHGIDDYAVTTGLDILLSQGLAY
jgi:hypothetical protein